MKAHQSPSAALPAFRIGSDALPSGDAVPALHAALASVFDVTPHQDHGQDQGDAGFRMVTYNLGSCVVAQCRMTGLDFTRSRATIARSGVDHFIIQMVVAGADRWQTDDGTYLFQPGDIGIMDLSQMIIADPRHVENISLVVPRAALSALLPDADRLHGLVLPGAAPMTAVLGAHLIALAKQVPHMSMEEAASVSAASLVLVATCLGGFVEGQARVPRAEIKTPLLQARRFIDTHLASPDLGLALLEQGLGMSRSTLFRLFEPFGGVAKYILHRRMTRAFHQIVANGHDARRIGEIARSVGMANEASFSRAFRRIFGVSPREARLMARPAATVPAAPAPDLHHWLQDLMPDA